MPRLLFALIGGTAAGVLVFWVNTGLLAFPEAAAVSESHPLELPVVFKSKPVEEKVRRNPPEKPRPPHAKPPIGITDETVTDPPTTVEPRWAMPAMDGVLSSAGFRFGEVGHFSGDGEPVTLRAVEPAYPRAAARNRVEGSVTLEFMIDRSGTVSEITVIAAKPRGVFEKSAIEALRKWRFKPRVVDGEPVVTRARQTLEFVLPSEKPAE